MKEKKKLIIALILVILLVILVVVIVKNNQTVGLEVTFDCHGGTKIESQKLKKGELLEKPTEEEKINMLLHHFELLLKIKNEKLAVLEIRTHAAYYLKGIKEASSLKNEIFKVKTKEEFRTLLEEYKERRK